MTSRRAFLGGVASIAAGAACRSVGGEAGVLRVGAMSNVTHAPMLAGLHTGRLTAPGLRIESRLFRVGPRVTEALLGGAIDIGVVGPAPVLYAQDKHGPNTFAIVSGCASGGASFVLGRPRSDLRGAVLATPQVGTTQDIALRTYLRNIGLRGAEHGGDVRVTGLAAPVIKQQMAAGHLDGAWLPEPWASRIVSENGAVRAIDERDLWQDQTFATAVVVVRKDFLAARRLDVDAFIDGFRREVARASCGEAYEAIKKLTGNAGPKAAFDEGFRRVTFTADPMRSPITKLSRDAAALGLVVRPGGAGLFADTLC